MKTTLASVKTARTAGWLYLIIIVCGLTSEVALRGNLIISDHAADTAANILAAPGLFKASFALDTVMLIADIAIAVLFYLLFKTVNQTLATMALAFRLAQSVVLASNLLIFYAAWLLLTGTGYSLGLEIPQKQSLSLLFINLHSYGYDLGLIFFAFSNLALGVLMVQANHLPKTLGIGLIAAALVYLSGSLTRFLLPEIHSLIQPLYLIPLIVELAFCLWLLFKPQQFIQ